MSQEGGAKNQAEPSEGGYSPIPAPSVEGAGEGGGEDGRWESGTFTGSITVTGSWSTEGGAGLGEGSPLVAELEIDFTLILLVAGEGGHEQDPTSCWNVASKRSHHFSQLSEEMGATGGGAMVGVTIGGAEEDIDFSSEESPTCCTL